MKVKRTVLDQLLDRVKYGKSEVTIDANGYTPAQVSKIHSAAKSRGLNVSGTRRWLLVRDLGKKKKRRAPGVMSILKKDSFKEALQSASKRSKGPRLKGIE